MQINDIVRLNFNPDEIALGKNIVFAPNGSGKTSIAKFLSTEENVKLITKDTIEKIKDIENEIVLFAQNLLSGTNITDQIKLISNEISKIIIAKYGMEIDTSNVDSIIKTYDKSNVKYENPTESHIMQHKELSNFNKLFSDEMVSELNIPSYAQLSEMIESVKMENPIYEQLIIDNEIIDKIILNRREDAFKYTVVGFSKNIKDANNEILERLKKSSNKKHTEHLKAMIEFKSWNKISASTKKYSTIVEKNKKTINTLENSIIHNIIQTTSIESKVIKLQESLVETINSVNKAIKKSNLILSSPKLIWNFKINEIRNLDDSVDISIRRRGSEKDYKLSEFFKAASEGEKTFIRLIIALSMLPKTEIIVFDDVINSLDSRHYTEFIRFYNEIVHKCENSVFLTHNFQLFKEFGFVCTNGWKFNIIEMNTSNEVELLKINNSRIINDVLALCSNLKLDPIEYIVVFGSIFREASYRYLSPRSTKTNLEFNFTKLEAILDSCIRHYKRNVKVEDVVKEIASLKIEIPVITNLIKKLKELNQDDQISDIIIKYSENALKNFNFGSCDSLDDYIIKKILLGTYHRFKLEEICYYELPKRFDSATMSKIINAWEKPSYTEDEINKDFDQKSFFIAKTTIDENLKNIDQSNLTVGKIMDRAGSNYLVHSNNLEWEKIVEMPFSKIIYTISEISELKY